MTKDYLRLHPEDQVAVALRDLPAGQAVEGVMLPEPVAAGHKVALGPIPAGTAVRKYGQVIGFASREIAPGQWVHTHNLAMGDFDRDYAFGAEARPTPPPLPEDAAHFEGIPRADGRVGTRNYLGVIATVNCAATVTHQIAHSLSSQELAAHPALDGVAALAHSSGCGMAGQGEGFDQLQRVLAGFAGHPNFAGVLLVGLGCEVMQVSDLAQGLGLEGGRVRYLNIQETGGTRRTVARGAEILRDMLPLADAATRRPFPLSKLVVGLECGGSDAYSGITANPALGRAVDLLAAQGGTAILSETPEIYGAEHLLTRRAASPEVGHRLVERIRWWEGYTARLGGEINNNPSPGNKAGGLTTILEKSLGAAAKGGSGNLNAVYRYAEPVSAPGLVFMDTPGYDPPSITGMVAGGATLVCFTTGRGSVSGCKPAPVLKLATNTAMYQNMSEDMDINCGAVLDGDMDLDAMGREILKAIVATASGRPTKSEELGFGDLEFAPWILGATM